jgi:heme A synthase
LVIVQGLLGIFRVWLHARIGPEMAMVHGLFAQFVFAALVAVAVVTSRSWQTDLPLLDGSLRRMALFVAIAAYGQIVFGAMVRHLHDPLAQRAHACFAFVLVAAIVWLVREVWQKAEDPAIRRVAMLVAGLAAVQVTLGVEAWIRRFGAGVPLELMQSNAATDMVRSAHFLVGALLFATTVALNLLVFRPAVATQSARIVADAVTNEDGRIVARMGSIL